MSGLRVRRVEEIVDHRDQPTGTVDEPDVGGTRENGEPGARQTNQVAEDATAAQAEQLDGMLGGGSVGVPDHDHSRRGDRADSVGLPGEGLAIQLLYLFYQRR